MTEVTPRVLASPSRAALYRAVLAADRPLSVADGAAALGLAESTTRYHFDRLVSAGLVRKSTRPRRRGRPENRYHAAEPAVGVARGGDEYRGLASALADQLEHMSDPPTAAREAGRRWSRAASDRSDVQSPDVVDDVLVVMDRLGFAPDRPDRGDAIHLHRCPFEAVAREHRQVVCGMHLGLLEELLSSRRDGSRVAEFLPFAKDEPLCCVVRLGTRPTRSPDDDGRHQPDDNAT